MVKVTYFAFKDGIQGLGGKKRFKVKIFFKKMSLKKINNFLLFLFVFSLPFTAFSVLKIGEKDIIFSWFLIFLLALLNFPKLHKSGKVITILYVWFFILFLTTVKLGFLQGSIPVKGFTQLLTMVGMMVHLPVLYVIFKDKTFKEIKKLINVLIFSTFILVLYTFYQYSTYFFHFLPKIDILRNAEIYSIYKGSGIEGWSGTYRAYGVAPEPTFWASYLLIPLAFLIPYLFSFGKFWIKKIIFFLFFISLILTFGRSGWITFALILLISPLIIKTPSILKISYFLIILISITIIFGGVIGNFFKIPIFSDLSFQHRLYAEKAALEIFSTNPILGVGFGNFENFAEYYLTQRPDFSLLVTHNFYLRMLAETGILGFLIFLLFLGFLLQVLLKSQIMIRQIKNSEIEKFIQGLFLAFFSILVVWLFSEGYNFSYIWFIFALMLSSPFIFKSS